MYVGIYISLRIYKFLVRKRGFGEDEVDEKTGVVLFTSKRVVGLYLQYMLRLVLVKNVSSGECIVAFVKFCLGLERISSPLSSDKEKLICNPCLILMYLVCLLLQGRTKVWVKVFFLVGVFFVVVLLL